MSLTECLELLGVSRQVWERAVKRVGVKKVRVKTMAKSQGATSRVVYVKSEVMDKLQDLTSKAYLHSKKGVRKGPTLPSFKGV